MHVNELATERRERIREEASDWDARLRSPECTDDVRARFAEWRDADEEHRAVFENLQTLVALLREKGSRADVTSLRQQALSLRGGRLRTFLPRALAAAVCAVAVGLGALMLYQNRLLPELPWQQAQEWDGIETFSTGVGQQSSFVLRDGSTVELNAKSRIRVAFSAKRRNVELLEGQALFQVAKNPARPFVVRAGDREIIAVGTQFDVRLDPERVQVTLIEGKVRVAHHDDEEAVLTPGTQLVADLSQVSSARAPAQLRMIDVERVTGWREGRIFLEDLPLATAVAEMNKHSPVQVLIADASLEELRVNGMFRAGEQERFVAALEAYFPIVASRPSESRIVLTARR